MSDRHVLDASVAADRAAAVEVLDHRLGRPAGDAVLGAEGQFEPVSVGQALGEVGGQTVRRHHVETDAG
ncbi:hypothetical protein ACFQER_03475 [Halomicroarcula sp. GCM10025894]|uniref:hypothetical protein n=1 Tax=Halomicroarcula sp. GCM10025894 TaxID=3252673 RepID=UPI00362455F3